MDEAMDARSKAVRSVSSSLSIMQGRSMKKSPPPPMVKSLRPICLIKDYLFRCFLGLRRRAGRGLLLADLCQLLLPRGLELVRDDGLYETLEQRVGLHRPALELRMELAGNEPRVALQFHYLDE